MASSNVIARMRTYARERAVRLRACPGGHATKYHAKHLWHCDGCGEDFKVEAQALAAKHGDADARDGEECATPATRG